MVGGGPSSRAEAARRIGELLARAVPGAAPRGDDPPAWALSRGSAVAYVIVLSEELVMVSAQLLRVRRDDDELLRFLLGLELRLGGHYFALEDDDALQLRITAPILGLGEAALRAMVEGALIKADLWDDRLKKRQLELPPRDAPAAAGPSSAAAIEEAFARLGLAGKATPIPSAPVPSWSLKVRAASVQISAGPELLAVGARRVTQASVEPAQLLADNRKLNGAFYALNPKGEVVVNQLIPTASLVDDVLAFVIVNVGEAAER